MHNVIPFLFGALAAGCLTAAIFFLKFWSVTRDRLFLFFSLAFCLFAAERGAALMTLSAESGPLWSYVLRLGGFLLIIAALVEKNR